MMRRQRRGRSMDERGRERKQGAESRQQKAVNYQGSATEGFRVQVLQEIGNGKPETVNYSNYWRHPRVSGGSFNRHRSGLRGRSFPRTRESMLARWNMDPRLRVDDSLRSWG
jgi:hypothetical protein